MPTTFLVESFWNAFNNSAADFPEPKIITGLASLSVSRGYKKYFATSLEILINAYKTDDKSKACSNTIAKNPVGIVSNCRIYIPAQENPKIRDPDTQTKIESLESKYLIKDL